MDKLSHLIAAVSKVLQNAQPFLSAWEFDLDIDGIELFEELKAAHNAIILDDKCDDE